MNSQIKLNLIKIVKLNKNSSKFRCYYCLNLVELKELEAVDEKLEKMNSEMQEFLLDYLPSSKLPRKKPYIHMSDLGYNVLNICLSCFRIAKNNLNSE